MTEQLYQMRYYNDYPKETIGRGNPYYCCAWCKVSVPEINGSLERHLEWCEYRKAKTLEEDKELLEIEVESLKIDLNKQVYCVYLQWLIPEVASGDDVSNMRIFRSENDAVSYAKSLEDSASFNPDQDEIVIRPFLIF